MADHLVPGRRPHNDVSSRFTPRPNPDIFAAVEDGRGRGQEIR